MNHDKKELWSIEPQLFCAEKQEISEKLEKTLDIDATSNCTLKVRKAA